MKTVFITGADRGVGLGLCKCFIANGWKVFAGQFMPEWPELEELAITNPEQLVKIPLNVGDTRSVQTAARETAKCTDQIDMLINCAGIAPMNMGRQILLGAFNVNTIGPIRMVEAFLPLMQTGDKKLCFISSEAGSVSVCHRNDGGPYPMTKTSLNMAVRMMFNQLRKDGYVFRLYHPGWVRSYMLGVKNMEGRFEPEETAEVACRQFIEDREWEDVLAMTDVNDEIWPF